MKSLKAVKAQLLANPAVRQAYGAQAPEFELARELIAARMRAGLTQGDVAARMGTTQSVVARIESGRGTPSTLVLGKPLKINNIITNKIN